MWSRSISFCFALWLSLLRNFSSAPVAPLPHSHFCSFVISCVWWFITFHLTGELPVLHAIVYHEVSFNDWFDLYMNITWALIALSCNGSQTTYAPTLMLRSLFVICHHSLWAGLDCLLVVQGLCLLKWFVQVFGSLALFEYSLSGSFVLSCVLFAIHAFLCGSSIKIGCCKLGPLWPCLSPPAPTLIHRCSSNIHAPALSAWVVFWAPYKKEIYIYIYIYRKIT